MLRVLGSEFVRTSHMALIFFEYYGFGHDSGLGALEFAYVEV